MGGFFDAIQGGLGWAADTATDVLDWGSDILGDATAFASDWDGLAAAFGGGVPDILIDATGPIPGPTGLVLNPALGLIGPPVKPAPNYGPVLLIGGAALVLLVLWKK